MQKSLLILFLLLLNFSNFLFSQAEKPVKVGIALSGGAAKGFAHIGIMMAIDSAGLEIDAITGTSAGAIIGSLYSAGYTGKQIREKALSVDWTDLFIGKHQLDDVSFLEKELYGKTILDLPIEGTKIKSYTGLVETPGLWQVFTSLFYPVHSIENFSQLSIPFECYATDLLTGEMVSLNKGDLATAVRASMAIPSIFTGVPWGDKVLIDGGASNNLPVEELDKFEIDFKIAVDLSDQYDKVEDIDDPLEVLLYSASYKERKRWKEQVKKADLYIRPDLKGYGSGDFVAMDSIIEIGIQTGLEYYPYFKKLADSLNSSRFDPKANRLPRAEELYVNKIEVKGLTENEARNFRGHINLEENTSYTPEYINEAIEKAYGFLRYRIITYRIIPNAGGKKLIFDVQALPKINLQANLHYSVYNDIGIILGVNVRNLLTRHSNARVKMNIGQNFRGLLEVQQFFTAKHRNGLQFQAYYDHLEFRLNNSLNQNGLYGNHYGKIDVQYFHIYQQKFKWSLGIRPEFNLLVNTLEDEFGIAQNFRSKAYIGIDKNNLDHHYFPTRGNKYSIELNYTFDQRPNNEFTILENRNTEGIPANYQYFQFFSHIDSYTQWPMGFVGHAHASLAMNSNNSAAFMDWFIIGGDRDYLRNQLPFIGFREAFLLNNSFASIQGSMRKMIYSDIYLQGGLGVALPEFLDISSQAIRMDFQPVLGTYLKASYDSILGPLEFSIGYSTNNKGLFYNVFLGHAF